VLYHIVVITIEFFLGDTGAPHSRGSCAMARLAPWLIRPCLTSS